MSGGSHAPRRRRRRNVPRVVDQLPDELRDACACARAEWAEEGARRVPPVSGRDIGLEIFYAAVEDEDARPTGEDDVLFDGRVFYDELFGDDKWPDAALPSSPPGLDRPGH